MPQMAPIWWSSMFMLFIMMYIIMMTSIYFHNIYLVKVNNEKTQNFINNLNWKW